MRNLRDIPDGELAGKRVLVRAPLNAPTLKGAVTNDFRIRRAVATIRYLKERGACTILCAHIGRSPSETLLPASRALKQFVPLTFVPDVIGTEARAAIAEMRAGDVILLENLRREEGEANNDEKFARALAGLAELYVNDAFSVSHRRHASIVGVPKFLPHYAGFLLEDEVAHLREALEPPSPSLCILGGAKFDTKEPLIKKMLAVYDRVFVGGALANDVFRACGYEVGRSLVSATPPSDEVFHNGHLIAPVDVVAQKENGQARVVDARDVEKDEKIVDIGPDSVRELAPVIKDAAFILWNGPMGVYEEGFDAWTHALAQVVSQSEAKTVVGGGDTIAAIVELDIEDRFSFLSTGGGAMLEFLLQGTLPGIEALET